MESTSILSMPLGPSVERTASATALAAAMLLDCAVAAARALGAVLQDEDGCLPLLSLVHDVASLLARAGSTSTLRPVLDRLKLGRFARATCARSSAIAPLTSPQGALQQGPEGLREPAGFSRRCRRFWRRSRGWGARRRNLRRNARGSLDAGVGRLEAVFVSVAPPNRQSRLLRCRR